MGGVWEGPDHQLDDVIETDVIVKEGVTILQLRHTHTQDLNTWLVVVEYCKSLEL